MHQAIGSRSWRAFALTAVIALSSTKLKADDLTALEQLGKRVFFDEISSPATQSCSSCHVPETGWTTPQSDAAVMPGAVAVRFGNRKPLSNAYVVFSPVRDVDARTGGALWDARADGTAMAALGLDGVDPSLFGPAADQSVLPFTNPLEHNTTPEHVCRHVERRYAQLYAEAWGRNVSCTPGAADESFARIGLAIVAYEASAEVSAFASRFDSGELSVQERRGFELFTGEATCSTCHTVGEGTQPGDGSRPLFTSFTTFNIGVPRNPDNPFYAMGAVNDNLGDPINPSGELFKDVGDGTGRFKTPTLRNVGKVPDPSFVKRFTHNGFFNSLEGIVHFYNTRDARPACPIGFDVDEALANDCWPAPESSENLAGAGTAETDIGNLGLSADDEAALVAFLRSLNDDVAVRTPDSSRPNRNPRFDRDRLRLRSQGEASSRGGHFRSGSRDGHDSGDWRGRQAH
jgi:cytochrome c peroxidase